MSFKPEIAVKYTDAPGTAAEETGEEEFRARRPLLLNNDTLYVGGANQTHAEAMETHGVDPLWQGSLGAWLPEGGWNHPAGHVVWFDNRMKPEWRAEAERLLNAKSDPDDEWHFGKTSNALPLPEGVEPWTPGNYGKGSVHWEGDLAHWKTNYGQGDHTPTHAVVLDRMGVRDRTNNRWGDDEWTHFVISPEGHVQPVMTGQWSDGGKGNTTTAEHGNYLANHIGGKYIDNDGYFFGKTAGGYNVIDSDVTPDQSYLADLQNEYHHSPWIVHGNNVYLGPVGTHHADLIWRHINGEAGRGDPESAVGATEGWGQISGGAVHVGEFDHPHDPHEIGNAVAAHTGLPYEPRDEDEWHFSKTAGGEPEHWHWQPMIRVDGRDYWATDRDHDVHADVAMKHGLTLDQISRASFGRWLDDGSIYWVSTPDGGEMGNTSDRVRDESDLWHFDSKTRETDVHHTEAAQPRASRSRASDRMRVVRSAQGNDANAVAARPPAREDVLQQDAGRDDGDRSMERGAVDPDTGRVHRAGIEDSIVNMIGGGEPDWNFTSRHVTHKAVVGPDGRVAATPEGNPEGLVHNELAHRNNIQRPFHALYVYSDGQVMSEGRYGAPYVYPQDRTPELEQRELEGDRWAEGLVRQHLGLGGSDGEQRRETVAPDGRSRESQDQGAGPQGGQARPLSSRPVQPVHRGEGQDQATKTAASARPVISVDGHDYWGEDDDLYHAEVAKRHRLTPEQVARADFGRGDPAGEVRWYSSPEGEGSMDNTQRRINNEADLWQSYYGPAEWNFSKVATEWDFSDNEQPGWKWVYDGQRVGVLPHDPNAGEGVYHSDVSEAHDDLWGDTGVMTSDGEIFPWHLSTGTPEHLESLLKATHPNAHLNTSGDRGINMRWAGKTAAGQVMYHGASSANRQSISAHGLDPNDERWGTGLIYLTESPQEAAEFGDDVWTVDTSGLTLQPSQAGTQGVWSTHEVIGPERIQLTSPPPGTHNTLESAIQVDTPLAPLKPSRNAASPNPTDPPIGLDQATTPSGAHAQELAKLLTSLQSAQNLHESPDHNLASRGTAVQEIESAEGLRMAEANDLSLKPWPSTSATDGQGLEVWNALASTDEALAHNWTKVDAHSGTVCGCWHRCVYDGGTGYGHKAAREAGHSPRFPALDPSPSPDHAHIMGSAHARTAHTHAGVKPLPLPSPALAHNRPSRKEFLMLDSIREAIHRSADDLSTPYHNSAPHPWWPKDFVPEDEADEPIEFPYQGSDPDVPSGYMMTPVDNNCYGHAERLADMNPNLTYTEGLTRLDPTDEWGDHAWNVNPQGRIVDPYFEYKFPGQQIEYKASHRSPEDWHFGSAEGDPGGSAPEADRLPVHENSWTEGQLGKGYVTSDGRVVTWGEEHPYTTHAEVAAQRGDLIKDQGFYITPKGEIDTYPRYPYLDKLTALGFKVPTHEWHFGASGDPISVQVVKPDGLFDPEDFSGWYEPETSIATLGSPNQHHQELPHSPHAIPFWSFDGKLESHLQPTPVWLDRIAEWLQGQGAMTHLVNDEWHFGSTPGRGVDETLQKIDLVPWQPGGYGKFVAWPHRVVTWGKGTRFKKDPTKYGPELTVHHQNLYQYDGEHAPIGMGYITPEGEAQTYDPKVAEAVHAVTGYQGDHWRTDAWRFGANGDPNGSAPGGSSGAVTPPGFEPWEPGRGGKGFLHNGRLVTWALDGGHDAKNADDVWWHGPHHGEGMDALDIRRAEDVPHHFLLIHPEGRVTGASGIQPIDPQLLAADPRLSPETEEGWHFGSGTPREPSLRPGRVPGEIVEVPITGAQGDDGRPLIHVPALGKTFVGGPGSFHSDMVDAVPELRGTYHINAPGFGTIIDRAKGLNDNWHGRLINNSDVVWWDRPGAEGDDWHFGSGTPGEPQGDGVRVPWENGTHGKGLLHPDGSITHWQVNDWGEPHHADVMGGMIKGVDKQGWDHILNAGTFLIRPDGSTSIPADYWPKAMEGSGFTPQDGWHFGSAEGLPQGYNEYDPSDPEDAYKGLELKDGRRVLWSLYGPYHDQTTHAQLMTKMGIQPEQVARYLDSSGREPEIRNPGFQQMFIDNVAPTNTDWKFGSTLPQVGFTTTMGTKYEPWGTGEFQGRRVGTHPVIYDPARNFVGIGAQNSHHSDIMKEVGDQLGDSDDWGWGFVKDGVLHHMFGGEFPPEVHEALAPHGIVPVPDPDEWHFGKVAMPIETPGMGQPWEPGAKGKGVVGPDGRVYVWNDEDYYAPHHPEVVRSLDSEYGREYKSLSERPDITFTVDQDGTVRPSIWGDSVAQIDHIVKQDPRLKAPASANEWHFGSDGDPLPQGENVPRLPEVETNVGSTSTFHSNDKPVMFDPHYNDVGKLYVGRNGAYHWDMIPGHPELEPWFAEEPEEPESDAEPDWEGMLQRGTLREGPRFPGMEMGMTTSQWNPDFHYGRLGRDGIDWFNRPSDEHDERIHQALGLDRPASDEWHFGSSPPVNVRIHDDDLDSAYRGEPMSTAMIYSPSDDTLHLGAHDDIHHSDMWEHVPRGNAPEWSSRPEGYPGFLSHSRGGYQWYDANMDPALKERLRPHLEQFVGKPLVDMDEAPDDWHFGSIGSHVIGPAGEPIRPHIHYGDDSEDFGLGDPIEAWVPGRHGKGFIYGDKPYAWSIAGDTEENEGGSPHHFDVADNIEHQISGSTMSDDESMSHPIFIRPDGTVDPATYHSASSDTSGYHRFQEVHPQLQYNEGSEDDWHFGATAGWRNGLILPDGRVHIWPEEEAPHTQMAYALGVDPYESPQPVRFRVGPDNTIGPYYLEDHDAEKIMAAHPEIKVRGYPRSEGPRVSATGDLMLDRLIEQFRQEEHEYISMYSNARDAQGNCADVSEYFVGWLHDHGVPQARLSESVAPETFGYSPAQEGQEPVHTVALVPFRGKTWQIDWTAAQYGYEEFPKVTLARHNSTLLGHVIGAVDTSRDKIYTQPGQGSHTKWVALPDGSLHLWGDDPPPFPGKYHGLHHFEYLKGIGHIGDDFGWSGNGTNYDATDYGAMNTLGMGGVHGDGSIWSHADAGKGQEALLARFPDLKPEGDAWHFGANEGELPQVRPVSLASPDDSLYRDVNKGHAESGWDTIPHSYFYHPDTNTIHLGQQPWVHHADIVKVGGSGNAGLFNPHNGYFDYYGRDNSVEGNLRAALAQHFGVEDHGSDDAYDDAHDDDEWHFGKVGGGRDPWQEGDPIEPWEPGHRGKGMMFNGQPYSWKITDLYDGPHHYDVALHHDPEENWSIGGYFHIRPDGTVDSEGRDDELEKFVKHDPRLKMNEPGNWTFSKAAAVIHVPGSSGEEDEGHPYIHDPNGTTYVGDPNALHWDLIAGHPALENIYGNYEFGAPKMAQGWAYGRAYPHDQQGYGGVDARDAASIELNHYYAPSDPAVQKAITDNLSQHFGVPATVQGRGYHDDEWHFGKVAQDFEIHPQSAYEMGPGSHQITWKPGDYGRYIVDGNGHVHAWGYDYNTFRPDHYDYMSQGVKKGWDLMGTNKDLGYIRPDGTVHGGNGVGGEIIPPLIQGQAQPKDEWHFGTQMKTANSLWTPGTWGKGLWSDRIGLVTWNTGTESLNGGAPHHFSVAKTMGIAPDEFSNGLKDGSIQLLQIAQNGNTRDALSGQKVREEVFQADPRLKRENPDLSQPWHADADSWNFSRVANDLPPLPSAPDKYWKALTNLEGVHHVFPGDGTSHLEEAQKIGWSPDTIQSYWGWNPYADKWENFNRFTQDYRDIWDTMGNSEEEGHALPTAPEWNFSKTAYEDDFYDDEEESPFGAGQPGYYYHMAPTRDRKRIPVHGLQAADPSLRNPWLRDIEGTQNAVGVYMGGSPMEVQDLTYHPAFSVPYDIWQIDMHHESPLHDIDSGMHYHPGSIDPSRLKLHTPWEFNDKNPESVANHQFNELSDRGDAMQDAHQQIQEWRKNLPLKNPWGPSLQPHAKTATAPQVIEHDTDHLWGWEGRRPIVYHEPTNTIHVGPERAAHSVVIQTAQDKGHDIGGRNDGPRDLYMGWLGHNPEGNTDFDPIVDEGKGNEYGWYDHAPGPHVDDAIAQHFNVQPETDHWHFGKTATVPSVLYHWTEARNAPWIADEGLDPGVYLTLDDDPNQLNADIPAMEIPFRLTVDTAALSPDLFGQSTTEGYPGSVDFNLAAHGNVFYNGAIPPSAIVDMRKFKHEQEPAFAF